MAALGLSAETAETVREQFEHSEFRGQTYRHLPDARHGIERGTAVVDGAVVRGFPSIPRALVLASAVEAHFDGPVTVEEKLNGYNVRVARLDGLPNEDGELSDCGEVVAFTRSGYICPYTTRKVRDLLAPDAFFDDHPDLLLCGELVGPENPYTAHEYPGVDSTGCYVFDVRERVSGDPRPVAERRDLCETYDLQAVPDFGTHDPAEAVEAARDAIDDLDEMGREGVVLKSADGTRQLKYTTSAIHRADLSYAFSLPFDYGRDFVFARIVREAFQAVEFEESDADVRERARKLGEAILPPAVETIRDVRDGRDVGERHVVRGDRDVLEALLVHLENVGITMRVEADYFEDGERVVTFRKLAEATQDNVENYLDGQLLDQ